MNEGALATLDDDAALAEIASGTLMKQIAARHNCSKVAVYKRLSKHPDYPNAIQQQAESLVEQAVEQVFSCDADTVNIARARSDTAFKYAAARDPERWGQRAQLNVQVDLGGALRAISERLQSRQIDAASQQSGVAVQSMLAELPQVVDDSSKSA